MDVKEARGLLRSSQTERELGRQSIQIGHAMVESSQLIIQGLLRRFPELADEEPEAGGDLWEPQQGDRPRGADAVLSILQVAENEKFTVQQMTDELARRNLLPDSDNPENAVRTALERLKAAENSGVFKGRFQNGRVFYTYSEPPPMPPSYNNDEEPF